MNLIRLDLHKNTIVVLWGDHGWHLGDYGIWGKYTNFDVALRSPLIIKMPQTSDPGQFAEGIVETVDIFPTLADLCGLPEPQNLEGISMKPMIFDPHAQVRNYAVGARNAWGVQGNTIRSEQYRLMIWTDNNGDTLDIELFDNAEYPVPFHNIADEQPEIVQQLLNMPIL